MLTRILILLSLGTGCTLLLTGAWTRSPSMSDQKPNVAFVSQDVQLEADIIGSGVNANQLLQKALEKLDPARMAWLKTKVRQTMSDAESSFVAEGFLQRGPNQCAHLEMDIVTAGQKGRLLVISDGELLAEVRELPGAETKVEVTNLPDALDESLDAGEKLKEKFLDSKSCGGPLPLLEHIQKHLQNAKLQTGLLQDVPVIQIKGDIDPYAPSACPSTKSAIGRASVYLDAKTLWPHCVEWWGVDKSGSPRLILRVEFLESEINRELSVAECERLFSYRPSTETGK